MHDATTSVTAAEIARLAGVSRPTVSRILGGGRGSFRTETRERVLAAAERLGYRPNASARAIRRGRFGAIGLILATTPGRSNTPSALLHAIHDRVAAQGDRLVVAAVGDETLGGDGLDRVLDELCVDGLVVNYTHGAPAAVARRIAAARVPAVWLNAEHHSPAVLPDDRRAGREATARLLAAGHRRVDWLCSIGPQHHSVSERAAGYREAMLAAGLEPRYWTADEHSLRVPERLDLIERMLGARTPPEAVLAYGPIDAYALHVRAVARRLELPSDLSLATFADHQPIDTGLPLASMLVPYDHLAEHALACLAQPSRRDAVLVPYAWTPGPSIAERTR